MSSLLVGLLIIAGLIVGFLNVTGHEATPFLMAAVSLIIVSGLGGQVLAQSFGSLGFIGEVLLRMLTTMLTFVMPATVVVALKAIWGLARDE